MAKPEKVTVELSTLDRRLLKRIADALDPDKSKEEPKRLIEAAAHADDEPAVRHFGSV